MRAAGEIKFVKFEKCLDFYVDLIQGFFLIGVPLFTSKTKKRITSQLEALFDEGFHGTASPVGSLAFFISVLKRRGELKKSS